MKPKTPAAVIAALLSLATMGGSVDAQSQPADPNVVYSPDLYQALQYRNIGPSRGGRVTAVAGHAAQPSTFYMGATGGGVWKTTDYGQQWANISDGYFATASIGAIRVADSDPNIIYVGTGSDGIRSNVIIGKGVYKSVDAGQTWTRVGLETTGQIGAVLIHPANPDVVYVAAIGNPFAPSPDRGVYRTSNGGATWDKVLFVSDSTGAVDLEFAPDNPQEIYASMWRAERKPWTIISGGREGGVYKTTDGGGRWTQLTNGLPQGLRGKSDLAVSPADPNRVYVLIEAPVPEGGVYRSDDRGATFQMVSNQASLVDRPFYYTNIDADPTDADVLYVNSTGYFKSTDAGKSWRRRSTPHGDNHDMWINPNDPKLYIQSNDGGANVTRDGGETWSTQHNQPTAELYQVNVDDQFPYWVYAGQQDNSTIMVPSVPPYGRAGGPTAYWIAVGGCETGPAVPKPGDPSIVYSNCKGRFGRFSHKTGQEKHYYVGAANMYGHNPGDLTYRFQRVSPIVVSPHDPNVVYHASQYLHMTTDEGVTWQTISPDLTAFDPETQVISGSPITRDITGEEFYSTIYAVEESPLEPGVIWTGANDGPVYVTRDAGETWSEVTPPDLPPGGRVQTVHASPHAPGKAYVAVLRYQLDDWEPRIYRTLDYGLSWTRLSTGTNGIPADHPTRVVREDSDREGLLYAGTEFGMFVSFDDGAHWQSFQQNLPVTPITDIKVHRQDLVVSTMGRSFWILDNLTPLHQLDRQVASAAVHLFEPRDAHRLRYSSGGFRGGAAAVPRYPPAGVMIEYALAPESMGETTLEILDENGNTIRSFSSTEDPGRPPTPQQGMRGPPSSPTSTSRVQTSPGMHRFIWDMRYEGAWRADASRSLSGGPLATPGSYKARLTSGGQVKTQEFALKMDPRVRADGVTEADLIEQLALSLQVRDALSEARRAARRIGTAREALASETVGSSRAARRAQDRDRELAGLHASLVTAEGRYQTPMLIDQLGYLSGMIGRADQKPGIDAYQRYADLRAKLDAILAEMGETDTGGM